MGTKSSKIPIITLHHINCWKMEALNLKDIPKTYIKQLQTKTHTQNYIREVIIVSSKLQVMHILTN